MLTDLVSGTLHLQELQEQEDLMAPPHALYNGIELDVVKVVTPTEKKDKGRIKNKIMSKVIEFAKAVAENVIGEDLFGSTTEDAPNDNDDDHAFLEPDHDDDDDLKSDRNQRRTEENSAPIGIRIPDVNVESEDENIGDLPKIIDVYDEFGDEDEEENIPAVAAAQVAAQDAARAEVAAAEAVVIEDYLGEMPEHPEDNNLILDLPEREPELMMPLYYSDGMVFQMEPSTHNVWGLTTNAKVDVVVMETCADYTRKLRSYKTI